MQGWDNIIFSDANAPPPQEQANLETVLNHTPNEHDTTLRSLLMTMALVKIGVFISEGHFTSSF